MPGEKKEKSQEKDQKLLEKLIQAILKLLFGLDLDKLKNAGGGGGGMSPLDAIKQDGAQNYATKMLQDPKNQELMKFALKFPGVKDMVNDYIKKNDDPQGSLQKFAQGVLNDPSLRKFSHDLKDGGYLDGTPFAPQEKSESLDMSHPAKTGRATKDFSMPSTQSEEKPEETATEDHKASMNLK